MGLLYPWSVVESRSVPTPAHFPSLRRSAMDLFRARRRDIKCAALWGSVTCGRASPLSDIDIILVTLGGAEVLADLCRELGARAKPFGIVLDIRGYTAQDVREGKYRLGPSYAFTFHRIRARWVVGIHPSHCFRFPKADPQAIRLEMEERVTRRAVLLRNLARTFEGLGPSSDQSAKRLDGVEAWLKDRLRYHQKPMQYVFMLARRLLIWQYGRLPSKAEKDKWVAIDQVANDRRFIDQHAAFLRLALLNMRYMELLKRAVAGAVTRTVYLRKIQWHMAEIFKSGPNLHEQVLQIMRARREAQDAA